MTNFQAFINWNRVAYNFFSFLVHNLDDLGLTEIERIDWNLSFMQILQNVQC